MLAGSQVAAVEAARHLLAEEMVALLVQVLMVEMHLAELAVEVAAHDQTTMMVSIKEAVKVDQVE